MRTDCPVCGSNQRLEDWTLAQLVPDGWRLPEENRVCCCKTCGLIYYDNDRTQADYDAYYIEKYGADGSLAPELNKKRLDTIAALAMKYVPNKTAKIVDFGGGKDGYVISQLKMAGYAQAENVEVGDDLPLGIDLLISTEVFEHIYDLRAMMIRLKAAMEPEGIFLIQIPDAYAIAKLCDSPILDFHQKHVNHFKPRTLDHLFSLNGYERVYGVSEPDVDRNSQIFIGIYQPVHHPEECYSLSKEKVERSLAVSEARLRQVHGPVIIWGLGDKALMLLKRVPIDVVHYIDMDPGFRGATLGGKPILDHVEAACPIVIMAHLQKDAIREMIRKQGLNNEIILI